MSQDRPDPEHGATVLPLESLAELYDDAPCGYLTMTDDGTVVRVNETFLRWTGLRREDLVGVRRFSELLTGGGRIYHETHYAPLLRMQGEVREVALEIVRADGSTLPVLVSAVRRSGQGRGPDLVRTTVFDATHRRRYEQDLLAARRSAEASEARMRALQEVVERLAAAASSADVVDVVASAAGPALAARGSTVWLTERPTGAPDGSDLVLVAWTGIEPPAARRIPAGSALAHAAAVRDGEVHVVEPPGEDHALSPRPAAVTTTPGASLLALVPLMARSVVLGVLAVELPPGREVTDTARSLLGTLGRQAGQALERARLHDSEEAAARRSAFLLRAATVLSAATDFRDTLQRLANVAVPALADICLIDIMTDAGPVRMVGRHRDPERQALLDEVVRDYAPAVGDESPAARALATGELVWQPRVDADWLRRATRDERHLDLALRTGFAGYIAVPLVAEDRVLGVITLGEDADRVPFTQDDVDLATELGRQVALLAARAERFDVEYRASHALQAALLPPPPPPLAGLVAAVRYLPASRWAEVGGDFYDVLPLEDGSVAFAVGDVVGHDLTAAATMGQIRSVYRALMSDGAGPAQVVDRMQASWRVLGLERMATAVFGRLDPITGEARLASAGHPAPVLVDDDGARLLPVEPTTLLGAPLGPTPEWSGLVPPGGTLLLYTDGLVETRTQPLRVGLDRLLRAAEGAAAHDPEALCDVLLARLVGRHRSDDVALLALGRPRA